MALIEVADSVFERAIDASTATTIAITTLFVLTIRRTDLVSQHRLPSHHIGARIRSVARIKYL